MASLKNITNGWLNGFIGVVIFSASLPATRVAVLELDPLFVTFARATIAGILGGALLFVLGQVWPKREHLKSLFVVSLCVVIGFPLLTALALQHVTSAHSIVFIGLLPLSTAIFGVLLGGERPSAAFWVFSCFGSALVVGFAFTRGVEISPVGDALMFAAIILCGLGYAQGGKLSRTLGGWQVICWALVLSLPVMAPLMVITWPRSFASVSIAAWGGLAYVSVFSMLIGFIFWYRGLAQGGIAAVGQLQLLQPFFGLLLAALLLKEKVSPAMIIVTFGVVLCVAGAKKFAK